MLSSANNLRFLIIGEVYTDVHLKITDVNNPIVELGGIFHSARAFNSVDAVYALAYFAPSYLIKSIEEFSNVLKSEQNYCLGIIDGSPNVMIVSESKESGPQGYIDVLKDQTSVTYQRNKVREIIEEFKPSDILIYPGKYDISELLNELHAYGVRVHIDFHYNSQYIVDELRKNKLNQSINTAIISTSSELFKEVCGSSFRGTIEYFREITTDTILLKENRGGARLFDYRVNKVVNIPAFLTKTIHSVGVGDCFNSIFLNEYYQGIDIKLALTKASFGASLYASTLIHDEFVKLVKAYLSLNEEDISKMQGVCIPWELRKDLHIYIAAPDFPDVDCTHIEILANCLQYHNFSAHLPVRENGIIQGDEPISVQDTAFQNDLKLIDKSALLIAVLLYNDPGTLLELGMFAQAGKPTILYDPYNKATNLFLRKLPTKWCNNLGDVIDSVFELLSVKE
jgi:nucleoside 2-deoxyribosyltransferase